MSEPDRDADESDGVALTKTGRPRPTPAASASTPEPPTTSSAEPPVAGTRTTRPWWPLATAIVLGAVVVGLAVLVVLQTLSVRSQSRTDDRRKAAVQAASNEVSTLLTVSDTSSAQDLKALLAGATADFRSQLSQASKTFQQALSQGKVTADGSVATAALVSMNGPENKAVVAIAASATVKNSSSPNGDERNYRLTVQVQRVGDKWLVSGLAFVV